MLITMDALPDGFTPEVMDRLASVRHPSRALNVLVIVTNSDNPVFGGRDELVKAFFGEEVYQITFNRQTGETVDERSVFSPRGKFLKTQAQGQREGWRKSSSISDA